MNRCIFCGRDLTENKKPEHVLATAFRGRKSTTAVVCGECNQRFGGTIDKEFAEQLKVLRNQLQFPSGSGKRPPQIPNVRSGTDRLNIRNDGTPELVIKPFHTLSHDDGTRQIEIVINETEDLREKLARIVSSLAAKFRLPEDDIKRKLADGVAKTVRKRPKPFSLSFSFGCINSLRSITKSALVLWALLVGNEEVRSNAYKDARAFVTEGGEAFNRTKVLGDSRHTPSTAELCHRFSKFFTLVYVTSDADGRVVAHFTLYNFIAWRIVLAEQGGTPNIKTALVSNPINLEWSDTIAEEIDIPVDWMDKAVCAEGDVINRLATAAEYVAEVSLIREIEKLVEEVSRTHDVRNDNDTIPSSIVYDMITEISEKLALYTLRVPYEQRLTPDDLEILLGLKKLGGDT